MIPYGEPGPMSDRERYIFDCAGYLVIPDALTQEEAQAALEACERLHGDLPQDQWRQIGGAYEKEPALEALMDHPSILPKARALFGDRFILQSSWATMVPSGFGGGGFHEDGSSAYPFSKLAEATPLIQLRTGFILTDQSEPGVGNLALIPGSHRAKASLPDGANHRSLPNAHVTTGPPGTAVMFHQGTHHCGTENERPYPRHMYHTIYAPPWLHLTDRWGNSERFLERTTPMRRALAGVWGDEAASFHMAPLPWQEWEAERGGDA